MLKLKCAIWSAHSTMLGIKNKTPAILGPMLYSVSVADFTFNLMAPMQKGLVPSMIRPKESPESQEHVKLHDIMALK